MIKIFETKSIDLKEPILIEGFPDVGLVGGIAASHIVMDLKLPEVAYILSKKLPPSLYCIRDFPVTQYVCTQEMAFS